MFEKNRLEALSDGVFAVVITIMVLDLKVEVTPAGEAVPDENGWNELAKKSTTILSYVISFALIACFWVVHHHTLRLLRSPVTTAIVWMNFLFLFMLSLIPFATSFVQSFPDLHKYSAPSTLFSIVIVLTSVARTAMMSLVLRQFPEDAPFPVAIRNSWRFKAVPAVFAFTIGGSFLNIWVGRAFLVALICIWAYPDQAVEEALQLTIASFEGHSRESDSSSPNQVPLLSKLGSISEVSDIV